MIQTKKFKYLISEDEFKQFLTEKEKFIKSYIEKNKDNNVETPNDVYNIILYTAIQIKDIESINIF